VEASEILSRARPALAAASARVGDLVRAQPDLAMAAPGSRWSRREVVVHVVNSLSINADAALGVLAPLPSLSPETVAREAHPATWRARARWSTR
jgi:hypothetical protein